MSFQCNKDYTLPNPAYEYTEKLSLTPYRKTYAVNDTIWVQFQTINKTLFDKLSGNRISTDTTFLRVKFNFHRRYPNNAGELFSDIKVDNGLDVSFRPLDSRYNVLNFKTDCRNDPYFFRVGFVPKKTGVYSIEPHGDVSPCPNKLTSPYSTFKFTFDLADCNKDVWLSIPPQSRGGELGSTDLRIDKKEMFVFKVE
ncbi:MAG TPA: hypothetical protein VNI52_13535 [Sphingobacteriaceae bacterium]|nr:hypothetical protein [Sphingobacteriaceae bacterium]